MTEGWFFGFSYWKHLWVDLQPFFPETKMHFIHGANPLNKALKAGMKRGDTLYVWGRRDYKGLEEYAREQHLAFYRVEDGFIRSPGLGSDLTQPLSLVIDRSGLYFDPTTPSALETILRESHFDSPLLERAERVRTLLLQHKLSKYNLYADRVLSVPSGKKIILVPGQVEDDASLRYGAPGLNNLALLQKVRVLRPDAYIIYKPHPDVISGNRTGVIETDVTLRYCDRIETKVGVDSVLSVTDEVHTMTSLVGFEALLRKIPVVTHGVPFYAGWGLTEDLRPVPRRGRKLTLPMLVAGVLILYPRYRHPFESRSCEAEELLALMPELRESYRRSFRQRILRMISRMSQRLLRIISAKKEG